MEHKARRSLAKLHGFEAGLLVVLIFLGMKFSWLSLTAGCIVCVLYVYVSVVVERIECMG